MSSKLFVLPNDAYPFTSTKNTVRHTNFDADFSGQQSSVARTFSDFKGLGEIEIDASTIVADTTGSNQFLIPNLIDLEGRTVSTSTWMTLRSEAGGGDCAAGMAAGAVLLPTVLYRSGSFAGGVLFTTTSVGNLTAGFTGKFYVDMADGIPDNPTTKKETKKETKATYTVLD